MANENQGLDAAPQEPLDEHPRPRRARPEAPRAAAAAAAPAPDHECTPTTIHKTGNNGDEKNLKGPDGKQNFIGNFSKGLPHNGFGEVDTAAYQTLLHA